MPIIDRPILKNLENKLEKLRNDWNRPDQSNVQLSNNVYKCPGHLRSPSDLGEKPSVTTGMKNLLKEY